MTHSEKVDTGKVVIGRAYIREQYPAHGLHAMRLQSALLDPRTARPIHPLLRLIGPIVRWL